MHFEKKAEPSALERRLCLSMCIHNVTPPSTDNNWSHELLKLSGILCSRRSPFISWCHRQCNPKWFFALHRPSSSLLKSRARKKSLITRSTLPSVYISGIIMELKQQFCMAYGLFSNTAQPETRAWLHSIFQRHTRLGIEKYSWTCFGQSALNI